jgi:hypothetical protein
LINPHGVSITPPDSLELSPRVPVDVDVDVGAPVVGPLVVPSASEPGPDGVVPTPVEWELVEPGSEEPLEETVVLSTSLVAPVVPPLSEGTSGEKQPAVPPMRERK